MNKTRHKHRHTKVVFTIGPATENEDVLETLISHNVDLCRINMAHGTHDWVETVVGTVRKVCDKVGRQIPIIMDVKGPEIRTGLIDGEWKLQKDEILELHTKGEPKDTSKVKAVSVNYPGLIDDVEVGNLLLVDNGLIHIKVVEKHEGVIRCKVEIPGLLKSKRHINLPGIKINLPSLTEKDKNDLTLAISLEIEFIALSFVREAKDIDTLRTFLKERASDAKIIAKIEDQSGIKNLDEIIFKSDGVMVARGDLGIECPYQELPVIQRYMVESCINSGKPVIVATHMLESMINAPVPTRAEISDIATAVHEKADAIMLSGETTTGKFPVKCVEVMKNVSRQIESVIEPGYNENFSLISPKGKMLRSAVVLAEELENTGILVFSRSGLSAQKISSLRPMRCPLYIVTDNARVAKQMRLLWGTEPLFMPFSEDRNKTIDEAIESLKSKHFLQVGDYVVVLTNIIVKGNYIDSIQLRKIQ